MQSSTPEPSSNVKSIPGADVSSATRVYATMLCLLTLLFSLRVLGQVLVAFFSVTWLPPMADWYSGLIPYPILLAIQIVMLVQMVKICADIWRRAGFFARRRPTSSRLLIGFSAIYAAAMVLRYVLTMTLHPEMRWLGGTIPIFFHFVLAGFIFVLGRYHSAVNGGADHQRLAPITNVESADPS